MNWLPKTRYIWEQYPQVEYGSVRQTFPRGNSNGIWKPQRQHFLKSWNTNDNYAESWLCKQNDGTNGCTFPWFWARYTATGTAIGIELATYTQCVSAILSYGYTHPLVHSRYQIFLFPIRGYSQVCMHARFCVLSSLWYILVFLLHT